jgi:carboxymethylenebutenolidase
MDQTIIDLYDEYTHRPLDRRVFLERLTALVGSAGAATAALSLLEPNAALAQTVAESDPRIRVSRPSGAPHGLYAALPASGAKKGAVLVVHENRGLNAHIMDVTRRYALAGFNAYAADYLTGDGGTPADADKAREMIGKVTPDRATEISREVVRHLSEGGTRKVGMVGFCWGGGVVNRAAVAVPELSAGVVYYGVAADPARVPDMKAALLVHLAGVDERVNSTYPAYEAALKAAGKRAIIHRYEGLQHAFNNDTSAERFNAEGARLANERTVNFFAAELG